MTELAGRGDDDQIMKEGWTGETTAVNELPHADMEPLGSSGDYRHNPIPYINQRWDTPDDFNGSWACGPTSCVMALAGSVLPPWPLVCSGVQSDYGQYVSRRYTHNNISFYWTEPDKWGGQAAGAYGYMVSRGLTYWQYVTKYLALHGRVPLVSSSQIAYPHAPASTWLRQQIDAGRVVVTTGQVFGYGHLIVICGYDADKWIVNDPWGDGTQSNWGGSRNGAAARYTWQQIDPKYFWSVER